MPGARAFIVIGLAVLVSLVVLSIIRRRKP